jgi:flagellar biosynthesis protein FlhA
MKKQFPPGENPDFAASIIDSCVQLCDVVIVGEDAAAGLKYSEENMFATMIVLLEKGSSAGILVTTADKLNIPVINNALLMKNISSYGKSGEVIPETLYRDVSLMLARLGSPKLRRHSRSEVKCRRGIPIKVPRPLVIELGTSLFSLTGEEPGREKLLAEPLGAIRKKLIKLLGISIQLFRICESLKLKNDEYRILFKGLEAGRGRMELGWYVGFNAPQSAIPDIMNNPENIKITAKAAAAALIRHVSEIVQRRAPELLGRDEVEAILDAAEEKYPVVTGEVKSLLSLGMIREILQNLVSEQVSIRHIAVILETLADWGGFGPAPNELVVEEIRQSLKRQICLEYADDRLTLRVLTLEPRLEKRFADRTIDVTLGEDWADLILSAARGMEDRGFPPVVLCSPKARLQIKEATRRKLPHLAVLSYVEIPSDISVEPVGEIRFEGNIRFPENMF